MRRVSKIFLVLAALVGSAFSAQALNPSEKLSDPALEQRARALSTELRCLVCQNQSIDDSDAQLAKDLRLLVREQLIAGKTDNEIKNFLVKRYGEFVLLKPKFGIHTLGLWLLPMFVLIVGFFGFRKVFGPARNEDSSKSPALSEEEQLKIKELMRDSV